MKYEQEDLLEKFIQNEKKSKFWALLSAAAFTLISVSVVYVAKEVTGGSKIINVSKGTKDTVYKTETVIVTKDDPKVNEQLKGLRDSLKKAQIRENEIRRANDEVNKKYTSCITNNGKLKDENGDLNEQIKKLNEENGNLNEQIKTGEKKCDDRNKSLQVAFEKLRDSYRECAYELAACKKKPDPGIPSMPPDKNQINILIKYSSQVPDTTVDKLQKLLGTKNVNIKMEKMPYGLKPGVIYFNTEDEKMANSIASKINGSSYFRVKYTPYLNAAIKKPAGNFEISLTNN